MVAISILSISIAATFTAVQNAIQSSTLAKDQITGFYLAQEAMEYIKNVRDENALKTIVNAPSVTNWLYGLSDVAGDPCYFGKTCTIDSPNKSVWSCPGSFGSCPVMNEDSLSGLFGYNAGWTPTNFKREIQFQQVSANIEVAVTVSISWNTRGVNHSFQVKESLFNRQ